MLVFPTRALAPKTVSARLVGGANTGGRSVGGGAQYGEMSGGGFWSIEQRGITVRSRATYMMLRALASAERNGSRALIVPVEDRFHQPVTGGAISVPFSDLTLFDDAVAWDQMQVDAVLSANANLRATQLALTYTAPQRLIGGEFFSILHGGNKGWRLYTVDQVVSGGLGAGDATVINISPPLRASALSATPLNFDSPRCVCRVSGGIAALYDRIDRVGTADAVFEECFPETLA